MFGISFHICWDDQLDPSTPNQRSTRNTICLRHCVQEMKVGISCLYWARYLKAWPSNLRSLGWLVTIDGCRANGWGLSQPQRSFGLVSLSSKLLYHMFELLCFWKPLIIISRLSCQNCRECCCSYCYPKLSHVIPCYPPKIPCYPMLNLMFIDISGQTCRAQQVSTAAYQLNSRMIIPSDEYSPHTHTLPSLTNLELNNP